MTQIQKEKKKVNRKTGKWPKCQCPDAEKVFEQLL